MQTHTATQQRPEIDADILADALEFWVRNLLEGLGFDGDDTALVRRGDDELPEAWVSRRVVAVVVPGVVLVAVPVLVRFHLLVQHPILRLSERRARRKTPAPRSQANHRPTHRTRHNTARQRAGTP
eukprot:898951-Rhodomonas_salina.1